MYTVLRTHLVKLVALASASLFLGLAYNAASKHPLSLWSPVDAVAEPIQGSKGPRKDTQTSSLSDSSADPTHTGLSHILLQDVATLQESGGAILIDAREPLEYREGHIPGAINVQATSFRKGRPEILDYLPQTERYLVYCSDSQHCTSAELLARRLGIYGFKNVSVFPGGFAEWKAAGLEVQVEP
jgi:rhodanese-related sulfurtransferase